MHETYRDMSFIRIQDSIVMVHGCSSTGDLLWNWKTGILVYIVSSWNAPSRLPANIPSVSDDRNLYINI